MNSQSIYTTFISIALVRKFRPLSTEQSYRLRRLACKSPKRIGRSPLEQELESHLRDFIQWAFHQSHSQDYSNTEVLSLLGAAWKAQKLLWQLQTCQNSVRQD